MNIDVPKAVKIMGAAFMVAGLVMLMIGGILLSKALDSADWPTAPGRIIASEVGSRRELRDSSSGSRSVTMYYADIRYSYSVEGADYTSERVSFGEPDSNTSGPARSIVKAYPAGKEVLVHYNPDKPTEAVLQAGAKWTAYLLPGMGILFLIVGTVVYFKLAPFILRNMPRLSRASQQ